MTLIYEFDIDILQMYQHKKNEVSRSRLSKVRAQTGQTDTQTDATENITIVALAGDKIYGHHRHAELHLHITFQLWFSL